MAKKSPVAEAADMAAVMANIVHDSGKLVEQQIDLLRAEVGQEFRQVAGAAVSVAAGGGLAAAGGLLSGMMLAHLLHRTTRLPLWSCYGVVGGALGAASAAFLQAGRSNLTGLKLVPPQTAEAAKENVAWLKNQMTPAAT